VAAHADGARGRLDQTGDQIEHGRLAAAGLAEHGDDLALRHFEREVFDGQQVAAPIGAAEHLAHVVEADERVRHSMPAHMARSETAR
jgi:hypothetical protein